ncbi:MAG: TIGR00282 family metallophosphoesterase [Anaerorhabdus sp.]
MNILFLGDVVGAVGRVMVQSHLAQLKQQERIDLVIVNGENSAHGKGITTKIYHQFKAMGVDVITLGNHAFSKGEILESMKECSMLVRPFNLDGCTAGRGFLQVEVKGLSVLVVNLCGTVFMDHVEKTPYQAMDEIMEEQQADIYFVDLHAEATAEKSIFWNYFKEKVQVVVGTHTHIQTADERVESGSAFITDVGMCGAYDSVLGRDTDEVLKLTIHKEATHYTPANGAGMLNGVVVEVDEVSKKATAIKRIQIRP